MTLVEFGLEFGPTILADRFGSTGSILMNDSVSGPSRPHGREKSAFSSDSSAESVRFRMEVSTRSLPLGRSSVRCCATITEATRSPISLGEQKSKYRLLKNSVVHDDDETL